MEQSYAEYLTTGVIAQYCGVSRVTVLRWIQKWHLPGFKLPAGHYRIHRDDFSEFLMKYNMLTRTQTVEKEEQR
ncbi:MAG: helix-turn-helix domain-containing protein [Dehalococcoidales bacterium]|nr:helix-turn-helix domain-containing protein [Dehalococcoidales bacterium]